MIGLLRWCARLGGVGALVVGLMLGRFPLFHLHMTLGGLVALALLILAFAALGAKVRAPVAVVAIVWAIVLVYVGMMQNRWMPGSSHWVIEAVHVLIGIGGVGLAEMLAGAVTRRG
ncbi:MAG TPA: hypothetical protein VG297_21040 [Bryobacteraceae bacterium]|jgi:hypothetical protein|nr:hypothetical protein [Bryobacteraceae bacterium]